MINNHKFVLFDPAGSGYVYHSRIEGWIFTIKRDAATKFDSEDNALEIQRRYYSDCELTIVPLESDQ